MRPHREESKKRKELVKARIIAGDSPESIMEEHNVSLGFIMRTKKELIQNIKETDTQIVTEATPQLLQEVAEEVKKRTPQDLRGEVNKLVKGVDSLQRLETSFHEAFDLILLRANDLLSREDIKVTEWQIVTNTLSNAYKDVFHSKGTTINVAQADNINGQQANNLTMFQSRMKS